MKDTPRRNIATIIAHTLFIIMLFVLPELMMAIAFPHRSHWTFYPGFYTKLVVFLAVFYINYFYMVDRQLGQIKPRIWQFVCINAGIIVLAIGLNSTIQICCTDHLPLRRWDSLTAGQRAAGLLSFALRDAVMMVLAIGLAAAMRLSTRWADIQLQRQKLLAVQRTSELASLKNQLNPHFLFNTLNSIYALVDLNPEDAKEAVHKLSGMLRYMLYEDKPAVPLRNEADFIENYVSLMQLRLRLSDHPLKTAILSREQAKDIEVPPLIFIPLVENALKYGVDSAPGSDIEISLTIESGRIVCRTVNAFEASKVRKEGGIGLANLRRRLVLIYRGEASLHTSVANSIFTARLSLPLTIPALQPNPNLTPEDPS